MCDNDALRAMREDTEFSASVSARVGEGEGGGGQW